MKKAIFLCTVIAAYLLAGCSKTSGTHRYGEVVQGPLYFYVRNVQGQNLLDPSTPGHYKEDNIKIIYLINGKEKLYYEPDLDWSRGFSISKSDYRLTLVSNYDHERKLPSTTTYIQWNANDRDTIVCDFRREDDGEYKFVSKVFYNSKLIVPENYVGELSYNGATLKVVK